MNKTDYRYSISISVIIELSENGHFQGPEQFFQDLDQYKSKFGRNDLDIMFKYSLYDLEAIHIGQCEGNDLILGTSTVDDITRDHIHMH